MARRVPRRRPRAASEPGAAQRSSTVPLVVLGIAVLLVVAAIARSRGGPTTAPGMAAQRPLVGASVPNARPATTPAAPTHIVLDAAGTQAMLEHLRMAPPHSPVWIDAREDDPTAVARASEIAAVFRNAGWDVKRVGTTQVRVLAGLFLFLAGTEPPDYVNNAYNALDLAHIPPTTSVGYRAYYDEAVRTRPGFVGFHFDPDQTWLLVVGRMQ